MAEALNGAEELLMCGICGNKCAGPRKLPECEHQFCESCIFIRVTKLKDNDDLVNGFPCPSCEVISQTPNDITAAIQWIKSLNTGTEMKTKKQNVNCDAKALPCSPCKAVGKSTKAVKRCDDCSETLCESCSLGRHSHPLLKEHTLRIIGDSNENAEEAGEILNALCKFMECDEHRGCLVTFFCKDDEAYACETCVTTNHKDCKDVVKANAASAEKDKVEEEVALLKSSVENLNDYATSVIHENRTGVDANAKQVDSIEVMLKSIRENINRLLDVFQENALASANSAAKKRKLVVDQEVKHLENMKTKSALYLKLLQRLQLGGSLSQTDVITRMMKKQLKTFETDLHKMSQQFKKTRIQLKQQADVLRLPNDINDLIHAKGTIQHVAGDSKIPGFQSRLLLGHSAVKRVKKIEISMQAKYIFCPNFSVVEYLRNGSIVLVDDTTKACIMVKETGEISETLQITPVISSWTITCTDPVNTMFKEAWKKDKLIALPLSVENKIVLVSTNDKLDVKHIVNTVYQPKALHVMKNGDVAVAWNNPVAIGIISFGGALPQTKVYFRKDKTGRELKSFDYLAIDEQRSHVIQPCKTDNAVYCFGFDGDPKFRCGDISTPRGVDLVALGNIYVLAQCLAQYLHVITPDGLQLRSMNLVPNPRAMSFHKDGDKMVVTQDRSYSIAIFKLKKHVDAEK